MKEKAIAKINAFGKVGSIITTIMQVICIIGAAAALIGAIICFIMPKELMEIKESMQTEVLLRPGTITDDFTDEAMREMIQSLNDDDSSASIDLDSETFLIVEAYAEGDTAHLNSLINERSINIHQLGLLALSGVLVLVSLCILMMFCGKLCKAFRECETPFTDDIIRKIKAVSYSMIPWAIASMVCKGAVEYVFSSDSRFSLTLNLDMVLAILIVFGLSYVFQFGAVLQQESDETL